MANFTTSWTSTDELLPAEFNRIISNLEEINVLALSTAGSGNSTLQTYDDTITGYSADSNTVYLASWFNTIEANIVLLAGLVGLSWTKVSFTPNGKFITFSELNRLETEMEYLYGVYTNIINHMVRLPITLGMRSIF